MKATRKQIEKRISEINVSTNEDAIKELQEIQRMIHNLHGLGAFGLLDGGEEPGEAIHKDVSDLFGRAMTAAIKSIAKAEGTNEVLFSFRVPQGLRDDFTDACGAADTTPSQSIRKHMRETVDAYNSRIDRVADAVTEALGGKDCMLVPLSYLINLSRAGGDVGNYVNGIIYARRSLQAAGIETA